MKAAQRTPTEENAVAKVMLLWKQAEVQMESSVAGLTDYHSSGLGHTHLQHHSGVCVTSFVYICGF